MPTPTPAPYFDHGRYCRTAGLQARDAVFQHCWTPDNRCNTVMQQVDMGGPLDAPAFMPAGSVEGLTVRNFAGEGRPTVATTARD